MADHPTIIVASRAQADALSTRGMFNAIIAIVGVEDRPCTGFERARWRLQLNFDDILADTETPLKPGIIQPRLEDMQALCQFAEELRDTQAMVLCHCTAGRSRSPAAALACLACWHGPGEEDRSAKQLFAIRPNAYPNRSLVAFADQVLNRNGHLLAAVNANQPALD